MIVVNLENCRSIFYYLRAGLVFYEKKTHPKDRGKGNLTNKHLKR